MELPTPLERAPDSLCEFARHEDVWLKREDVHELGVFKWRGALPVVEDLTRRGHEAVVTASTGNHGAAVAWACRTAGIRAVVFVPPGASQQKLANLDRLGADVRVAGRDLDDAKDAARTYADESGTRFFEDGAEPLQYDAYATIGEEILDQAPAVAAAVVTPIGNGALAGGIGAALARARPGVTHIGVVTSEMPVMAESYAAGRPVDRVAGTTIADGMAVRVAIPLAVERLATAVDRIVRVSERDIAAALVACHEADVPVEPSAAATLAAARNERDLVPGATVVLVLTGRNVDAALVERARHDLDSFPSETEEHP
jgi:threonine dehydratase